MDIEKLLGTLDQYLSTDGCNLDNETVQPVEGIYEAIEPSEIYDIAVKELPAEDIDHHGSDLYLRKTPKSTQLIKDLKYAEANVQTFIDNIEGDMWYDLPFCYPEKRGVVEELKADIEQEEYKEIDVKEPEEETVAKKLLKQLESLNEGATAAVTIYFDHDPRNDYRINADIDTISDENKITLKNILIADYYHSAIAEDGGYIQFEENAMKEAFVKDYNEYERMEDDPEITVEDIEKVYLGGYEDIQPLVYGAGSWVHVGCEDGTLLNWEKETYLPRIEICAIIEGEEHRAICDCDGIYHPSNEACMIIDDVERAERSQHPEDYDDLDESLTAKKSLKEFYDVEPDDNLEMSVVSYGMEDELERFELDGIEFYRADNETLENAINQCIEDEFMPHWESECGINDFSLDRLEYDEESGTGKAIVTVFGELDESLNEDMDLLSKDATFRYMMLDRLRMDCGYFLGNGNRNENRLWAGSVEKQIQLMKDLYNSFEEKPEWISMEEIENYEKQMKSLEEGLKIDNIDKRIEEYRKANNLEYDFEIKQFDRDSEEWAKLRKVGEKVSENSPIKLRVEDTYFDFGQNWLWTTLIAIHEKADGTSTWQAIYPTQQALILAGYGEEVADYLIEKYNEQYGMDESLNEVSLDLADHVNTLRKADAAIADAKANDADYQDPELNAEAEKAIEKAKRNNDLFRRWKEAKGITESLNEKKEEVDVIVKYEDGDKLHQIIRKDEKYFVQYDVKGQMKQKAGVKNLTTAIAALTKKCPNAKEVK